MRRSLLLPVLLLAAAMAAWIALHPEDSVGRAEPQAAPAPQPTATAADEQAPIEMPAAPAGLPPGLRGSLTYRTGIELVTVQFPDADEIARAPIASSVGSRNTTPSADGAWHLGVECEEHGACDLFIASGAGGESRIDTPYTSILASEWSPAGHAFAFVGVDPSEPGHQVVLIADAASPNLRVVAAGEAFVALTWRNGDEILTSVAANDGAAQVRLLSTVGESRTIGTADAHIGYFYASPDRERFAFTQSSGAGWRLSLLDTQSGVIADLGNMGSDGPDGAPVTVPPGEGKGPMAIAWSPDGAHLAFGGGFAPPYHMTVVDVRTGAVVKTGFERGYPGEIRWSPDSSRVAVSTYDVERTHHETWVVEPASGAGTHLMDGCVIVWSPDSRFLAVHGEDAPGISIVNLSTGDRGQLTQTSTDAPLEWTGE